MTHNDLTPLILNLIPMVIFVTIFVFWGLMARDLFENPTIPRDQRMLWILGFLFFSFPTAVFYYFIHYRARH